MKDAAHGLSVHATSIRVRLKEVAFDHVYFGTVFTWFEVGRSGICRAAGAPYGRLVDAGLGSFVTSASAKYRRPIPPAGTVRLECRLTDMGRSRFAFAYTVSDESEHPYVTGRTEHAMADHSGRIRRIPDDFRAAFTATGEARAPVARQSDWTATGWEHGLRVRFEETDAFGVAYYGNYIAWMEAAWSAHLAGGPWDIAENALRGRTFSVIDAECRYLSPARYDDEVVVGVRAELVGRTKIQLDYRMSHRGSDQLLATGRTVHVAAADGAVMRAPDDLVDALGARSQR